MAHLLILGAIKLPRISWQNGRRIVMNHRKDRRPQRHPQSVSPLPESLEPRIALSGPTFFVTTNADAGNGSLRTAILHADQSSVSTIDFELKPGSLTINLVHSLPLITSGVLIDGTSQPGYNGTPLVTVNGSSVQSPGTGFDFVQNSSGSTIRGLAIVGFNSAAIMVDGATNVTVGGDSAGDGNVISDNFEGVAIGGSGGVKAPSPATSDVSVEGNLIGTDSTGTTARPNVFGVFILAANNSTIGGNLTSQRNIISGNTTAGIVVLGGSGNTVVGNFIGTNSAGTGAVANGTGVEISGGATKNTVGAATSAGGNLISGNTTAGVAISGVSSSANLVASNFVGTTASGKSALPNGVGVAISGGTANVIGGTTSAAANVISGNASTGISLSGTSVTRTLIRGNKIGTDLSGSAAIANATGVEISGGSSGNVVGGAVAADRNIISGNTTAGVAISDAETSINLLAGNFIGTSTSGQAAIANGIGILASGGTVTTIGGTTSGAGNVISGNNTAGIELDGTAVRGVQIMGNRIGTNPSGTAAVVHAGQSSPLQTLQNTGIAVIGSQSNTIGGTTMAAGNLISGNYVGVTLADIAGSASANRVFGNLIGTDASGTTSLGNIVGVYINGAAGNQIGGTFPGSGNVISGNSSVGVEILGSSATANLVQGNDIGLAANGQNALRGNRGLFVQSVGIFIQAASANVIGGSSQGAGNVISGNESAGVFILSRAGVSQGNSVQGNFVGGQSNGSASPGNDGYGVLLDNAPRNSIGRTGAAANRFGRNGIATIRNYLGPPTPSMPQVSAQANVHPRGPARRGRRHA
jgi:titin